MIVCIAEKPSVGRDIARILGATQAHDGYMEGHGYQVTWTFGHLCGLLNPEDYTEQWKRWNLSSLPMIPGRFGIKVAEDAGIQKQFNIVKNLFLQADEIINCGDAGQEGELIQRWVLQKTGAQCPVKRLWINSMTDEAIREGFRQLKDQSAYQHLYEAGMMRAIGDWLLGMNATRAYTIRYGHQNPAERNNRQPLSIGRVQTPTLALVVKRYEDIQNFVPVTYWELKTEYKEVVFSAVVRKSDEEMVEEAAKSDKPIENVGIAPITSAETGRELVERLKALPFMVTKIEKKPGVEYAPRLFDLTSLQVECNKRYGYGADKTLQLIQSLYEKKVATYPRVDTTYLPDDVYPKVGGILKGIASAYPQVARLGEIMRETASRTGKTAHLPKSKKVFDNSKVTDHHAIIPTGVAPRALSQEEQRVYDLIALRFIAAFYPECKVSTTTVWGEVADEQNRLQKNGNGVIFKTSGRQILQAGWREVFSNEEVDKEAKETKESPLPDFQQYEMGSHRPDLLEKQTTPPKPYTEATLLRAMETAGKNVEDEELRDAMKENGIGRPSTRAEIIKKLYQRNYMVQKGKSLIPTEVGIRLIHTIISPLLKSAELTGLWEKKLREIERGEYTAQQFLDELKDMTTHVVREVKTNQAGLPCPICHRGTIIRGRTRYGCSRWREGCSYNADFDT